MGDTHNFEEYFKKRIYSINHPGMRQGEMINGYKDWIQTYEQDLSKRDYSAPKNAALAVSKRFTENMRRGVRILDIGAGTGLVADELLKYGFVHIDALEPIQEMLAVAKQKNIYENFYQEFLSDITPTSIPEDSYDCVTAAGCFHENHIPWKVIPEIIRVVKSGGLIAISTKSAETDYYAELDNFVDGLVKTGKLSKCDRTQSVFFKGTNSITYSLIVS